MAIKIAFIGAGSVGFTRRLFRDVLTVDELRDTHFSLHDINEHNLEMVAKLCQKDLDDNDLTDATVTTHLERREALDEADFVINCTRIGGLEAYRHDIDVPLKYGLDQCVGDTICAGGIMYGQRNIPCILDFCADIVEVAKDDALFLNYANPNAMNTWAANEYGGVQTLGLCHGVQGGHAQIASVIELLINKGTSEGDRGFRKVTPAEVHIICAGINHQTWYIQVLFEGEDWTTRLLEGFEKHPTVSKTEKVRIDVLRRFGYYSTESNGHLSEYLPWYRKRPREIRKWIDLSHWIHGETGGYLRVCAERNDWWETEFPTWLEGEPDPITPDKRSHEHGSYIIESLVTGRTYRGHFNVPNEGIITNLPYDAIVEVPGYVDANGVSIPVVGDLPMGPAAICDASINVQRLSVHAALSGDVELLKQAMMIDPLTGAVLDPEEISQMTDEMLIAQAAWLGQYAQAVPAAKKRIAAAKRAKTYRGTKTSRGAARLEGKPKGRTRKASGKPKRAGAARKAARR